MTVLAAEQSRPGREFVGRHIVEGFAAGAAREQSGDESQDHKFAHDRFLSFDAARFLEQLADTAHERINILEFAKGKEEEYREYVSVPLVDLRTVYTKWKGNH